MKNILKAVLIASVVVISINLSACNKEKVINGVSEVLNLNNDTIVLDGENISKEEILIYESPYKDSSGTYYRDKLNEEELELYKIFIYAYEHKKTKIEYKSSISDLSDSFKKVIQCLSAENPFIDWNQEYSYTGYSNTHEFTSTQLDRMDVDLKIQAYNRAKEILQTMPKGLSDYDKLVWIYSYVVNNISYVEDSAKYLSESPSFIYDGLIKGKTQCSGFADTVTMMCNLSGIESLTICGETDEGHAWNLINLDGVFYYCDPTSDSVIKAELPEEIENLHLSFLKSQEVFNANGYNYMSDIVIDFPKANDKKYDNMNIDFKLSNLSNNNDLILIAEKLMSEKSYVVAHLQKVSVNDTSEITNATNYILDYISKNMASNVYSYVTIQNLISEGSNDVVFFINFE